VSQNGLKKHIGYFIKIIMGIKNIIPSSQLICCHDTQPKSISHNDTRHKRLICNTEHKNTAILLCVVMLNVTFFIVLLNVIMLNVVMLNVIKLSVIMLNVVKLNVIKLNVILLNVILLNVVFYLLLC
jgi:hypothetical protein